MIIDILYPFNYNDGEAKQQALHRLFISIRSILGQQYQPGINICICDASPNPIEKVLTETFPSTKFKYTHQPMNGIFNPSKVRNIGVKQLVTSEIFFLSDVDMVYPPYYIKEMVDLMQPGVVRISPQHKNMRQDGTFALGDAPGNGVVNLKVFHHVKGFEEFYQGYGPEDIDLNYRMGFFGRFLKELVIQNTPTHMWHTPNSPRTLTKVNDGFWINRSHKLFSKNYVEANEGKSWGVLWK